MVTHSATVMLVMIPAAINPAQSPAIVHKTRTHCNSKNRRRKSSRMSRLKPESLNRTRTRSEMAAAGGADEARERRPQTAWPREQTARG